MAGPATAYVHLALSTRCTSRNHSAERSVKHSFLYVFMYFGKVVEFVNCSGLEWPYYDFFFFY